MGFKRQKQHRDASEADIVDALEKAGCTVYRSLPVDLAVRVPRDAAGVVRLLECKTPRTKAGNWHADKRQEDQAEAVRVTGTQYVTTPEQALRAVGVVG